jgi:hypothetical protein
MPLLPQGTWRLAASIAAALALAAALSLVLLGVAGAQPATPNITFTAPTSAAVGATFDVMISGDSGTTPVSTYGAMITLPAGLSFVSGAHQAGATFPYGSAEPQPGAGPGDFGTGAGHDPPDAIFAGALEKFTLRCDAAGDHALHLTANASVWYDADGRVATNLDADITVTCAAPTNTPTSTPTNTPTITPTPTSTGTATPTPTLTPTTTSSVEPTGTPTASPTSVALLQAASGTPSATPALVRANTTVEPSPQGTPAAAVQSQSSSPTGVTGLPKAGDGGTGPLLPWGSITVTVIILLMGAGSWVLYYGLREATPGD